MKIEQSVNIICIEIILVCVIIGLISYRNYLHNGQLNIFNSSKHIMSGGRMLSNNKHKIENTIQNLVFSSDSDKYSINQKYTSKYADLNLDGCWKGDPTKKFINYLQVDLPDFYHLDAIITKGYMGEWVTEYYVEYYDKYSELWKKINRMFNGNHNDSYLITNELNISTNKIRIFPTRWNKNPSLKVSIIGTIQQFSKCQFYKEKMLSGNENDQSNYYKLYSDNCLNVSKHTFDKVINDLRNNIKTNCHNNSKINMLEETLNNLDNINSKLSLELDEKNKKCCKLSKELNEYKQNYCPKKQLIDLAHKYRKLVEKTK